MGIFGHENRDYINNLFHPMYNCFFFFFGAHLVGCFFFLTRSPGQSHKDDLLPQRYIYIYII